MTITNYKTLLDDVLNLHPPTLFIQLSFSKFFNTGGSLIIFLIILELYFHILAFDIIFEFKITKDSIENITKFKI